MQKYIEAGNEVRLYGEDRDLIDEDDYDYELSSPRMLGRDIAVLAHAETLALVMRILDREIAAEAESRLVVDMLKGKLRYQEDFSTALKFLSELKRGIIERRK